MARKAKPYNSATDHRDKGDYYIDVSEGYEIGDIGQIGEKPRWRFIASLYYRTKTDKVVYTKIQSRFVRPRKKYYKTDDDAKNEAIKQEAYADLEPVMERYREYRRRTKKRYEVLREASREMMPPIPVLPPENTDDK
jgi:hypothetical protein